jgi:hypothetical protein
VPNQAPTVWLAADPPQGSAGTYSIRLYWGGTDPDGKVAHYEYLIIDDVTGLFDPANITDTTWTPISSNESTFEFVEPSLAGGPTAAATPTHTFVIRAVDNEMLPTPTSAYISFTAQSLLPRVRITVPSPGLGLTPAAVPPVSTFEWSEDPLYLEPDSVQWALVSIVPFSGSYSTTISYLRSPASASAWYPWVPFDASTGKVASWTTPELEYGGYVFAVRGKYAGGAMNPMLEEPVNVRRVRVLLAITGPLLAVNHPLIGQILTTACNYPLTIVDVAAHLPMSFTLSACADAYGGEVAAYRYGWDILDPDDPDQWEIDYTPYPGPVLTPGRAFSFGTHTFSAEAIDNLGGCSRIEVKVNIVRFTGERNLLVVDDFRPDEITGQSGWVTTNGAMPSDTEHDGFWLDMVSDVDEFDPAVDMIATSANDQIPITTLALYKNIVWSTYSDVAIVNSASLPSLYKYIRYLSTQRPDRREQTNYPCGATGGVSGSVTTNAIALALYSGVHVLVAGNHPIQNVVARTGPIVRWPMIPLYELEPHSTQTGSEPTFFADQPGKLGFAYRELCLETIDFGYLTAQRARVRGSGTPANQRYCPINGWRLPDANSRRDDTMRAGTPLDPDFPAITLRAEAASPGKYYQPSQQGLDVEVYNPAYFRQGAACAFVPASRPCFEPIYGLTCLDTAELTYQQPVAFWTGAFAQVVAEDIPGAVAARSAVFGFPPVFITPAEIKPGIERILFDEWQLPRRPLAASTRHRARMQGE